MFVFSRRDPDGHYSCGDCEWCKERGVRRNGEWLDVEKARGLQSARGSITPPKAPRPKLTSEQKRSAKRLARPVDYLACLLEADGEDREMLKLYLKGLTLREIGEQKGCSHENVRLHLKKLLGGH